MAYDWILDVLTDLKTFAEANDLTTLAECLEETHRVAGLEIAEIAGDDSGRGSGASQRQNRLGS